MPFFTPILRPVHILTPGSYKDLLPSLFWGLQGVTYEFICRVVPFFYRRTVLTDRSLVLRGPESPMFLVTILEGLAHRRRASSSNAARWSNSEPNTKKLTVPWIRGELKLAEKALRIESISSTMDSEVTQVGRLLCYDLARGIPATCAFSRTFWERSFPTHYPQFY